jgi:hypothetical protein
MSTPTPTSMPTIAFAKPQPPPRPIVMLLAHTDLVTALQSGPLLAHENLVSRVRRRSPTRFHPYTRRQTSPLSSLPESSEDEDSSDGSPHPSHSSASSTPAAVPSVGQQSQRIRISRPKGAGRQSLRDLLKWDRQRLDAVKVICFDVIQSLHRSHTPRSDCDTVLKST